MSDSPIKRIGVINWDCSISSETTFFGKFAVRSLGPREFRDRTPYYAIETSPDTILYRNRSVSDYEIELRHAIAAKIDYFAYCWYDQTPSKEHLTDGASTTVDEMVYELTDARMKHLASPLRDQLGLCAILITCHPYHTEALAELAETMKQPFYVKIDGRPLVYLFSPPWEETLERLRKCCRTAGTPEPYAVLMSGSIQPDDAHKIQALSSYGGCGAHARSWDEFFELELQFNEKRSHNGLPVVPHFSLGWNPSPRIKNPVPWCKYSEGDYAPPATEEQLLDAAARLKEWIVSHRE